MFVPIMILTTVGLFFGVLLAIASQVLHVPKNHRVAHIESLLPGINCGACGYAGCNAYAEAVVKGIADPSACIPGGAVTAEKIADFLGVEVGEMAEMVAVVHCKGGNKEAQERAQYDGLADCFSALLVGNGSKECEYGCLGLGSCVKACTFDALHVNENGIAVVDAEKCVGCAACVQSCPRNLIDLIPESQKIFLACSNHDNGAKVKRYCTVGCTGCSLCTKAVLVPGSIEMINYLPKINYLPGENFVAAAHRCPSKCFSDLAKARPKANIDMKCIGCGTCINDCPIRGAIMGESGERHQVQKDLCIGCGACITSCNVNAISMWGSLGYSTKDRNSQNQREII